jgi:outer membrane protein assembly factor BamB
MRWGVKSFKISFPLWTIVALALCAPFVRAQQLAPEPAWKIRFQKSINWYVRTSAGILLVRSGKSLTAIDGVDGKQLWKIDRLSIVSSTQGSPRGGNLLEIPGTSVLLINCASLPKEKKCLLLGVDLWTGAILWRQPAINDLVQVIPFYGTGKVLIVTAKPDRAVNTAISLAMIAGNTAGLWVGGMAGAAIDLAMVGGQEANGGDAGFRYHPVLRSLDPLTGATDLTAEYPRSLRYGFLTFRLLEGQLYLHAYQGYLGGAESIQGRVDLLSGNREWDTIKKYGEEPDLMPELQSANGRLIFAAEDVEAIDAGAGNTLWKSPKMGRVANVLIRQGMVVGSGGRSVFALDEASGALKWSLPTTGKPTNVLPFDEENAVGFCDKTQLVVADIATGKIIRETPLQMKKAPRAAVKIGKKFLLALAPNESSLYDVTTGQELWSAGQFDAAFPTVSFLVSHTPFGGPGWLAEDDLRRQIKEGWDNIEQTANKEPAAATGVERLRPFLEEPETQPEVLYESGIPNVPTAFDLFRIDTETGEKQEYGDYLGLQPDASASLGLMYFIDDQDDRTLTAFSLPHRK